MRNYTVIVDDRCGTARAYVVAAPTPPSAGAYALRIFNSHTTGGELVGVLVGEPQEGCFWYGIDLSNPTNVIDLRMSDAEKAVI